MSLKDICNMPVKDIADKDCALFMWVTDPILPMAINFAGWWGFTYKTVAFTWCKVNKIKDTYFKGMGYYTRSNPEMCLLFTKGKPLERMDKNVDQLVVSRIREHSRKPDEVKDRIHRLFGDVPKIELFAREQYDPKNWDYWGTEIIKLDDEEKQTNIYEEYKEEYANKNISKFDQPKIDENIKLFPYYVFFPCQLPHDETIQYHSDYSVIECLSELMNFTMHWGIPLIVKGHPVNPASMAPLKEIVLEKQKEKPDMIKWVENVSIHQCVKKCYAVYTVNSGVGMEALLHGKKVFRFGRTDYDEVSYKVEPNYNSLRYNWKTTPDLIQDKYPRFFEKYVQSHIDTRKWVWDRLPR